MPDWQEILRRDGPTVWHTAYRLLNHRADADEGFQEAILAALEVSRREEARNWRALLQHLATSRAVDNRGSAGCEYRPNKNPGANSPLGSCILAQFLT